MWDKRKLLIAAIVFTALFYKVTAERAKPLDMAPDAVDNLYDKCREQALEKFIYSGLLKQELNNSEEFQEAWSSRSHCSKVMPGKTEEHTAALWAYANKDRNFFKTFDNAVETLGTNASTYENLFHFKSLHFLLMDSMTLQPPNNCKTLYAIPEEKYTAKKGSKVRFGRFTITDSSDSVLDYHDLDEQVIFKITSCFFANLGENICSEEDAVLLSPAEVFTVEDVNKLTDQYGSEYTQITLKHSGVDGSNDCYIFSRSVTDVSTQWLVLVLVALSLLFVNY